VSSASSKADDLANSGVRRVKAQTLGVSSHEDARSENVTNRWIHTWDRASESHKKIPKELATRIASLRGCEISTAGGQVATTKQ
jgi:hypothetical protein